MTRQETFDKAVRGVIEQGRPSVSGGTCMYRGANGRKCAAGHLIPDGKYEPEMDSGSLDARPCVRELLASAGHDVKFVRELQGVHDLSTGTSDAEFLVRFRERAAKLAARYGLNTDVLTNTPYPGPTTGATP